MKYGWKYYFEPTPKNVARWLLAFKTVIGTASTTAFFAHSAEAGFYTLLAGGVLNELAQLFSEPPTQSQS